VEKRNYSGGVINFEQVDFRYELGLKRVLKEVGFVIQQGQRVALVGRSGAGKTTAAHLLLRFWDPEKGSIELDNHNLTEYKLNELRHSVSLVAQDTYLFNSTVRANLTVANPGATEDELIDAATKAAAHEFIIALPDQYDTLVGERGFQLSGGQRQRIAIARAFLKDAPVLVLDEATSHLDAINEALVHNALGALMQHRSSLIIAHRLSSVRDADIIVVMDDGRVVESGTADDLMASGGAYSQMVGIQIANQAEGNY
jgi:ATP-binding cassette subfamily C protein CydCD